MRSDIKTFLISACLCLFVLSLMVHYFSIKSQFNIYFVVPNNYRGVLILKKSSHGFMIKRSSDNYIVFDDSGVAYVQNLEILSSLHEEFAEYRDGTKLRVASPSDKGEEVCVRAIVRRHFKMEYMVGTKKELIHYMDRVLAD